jgi:hypothetical protein
MRVDVFAGLAYLFARQLLAINSEVVARLVTLPFLRELSCIWAGRPSRKRRLMIPAVLAPELRAGQLDIPATPSTDAMMSRQLWLPNAFRLRNSGAAVLLLPLG